MSQAEITSYTVVKGGHVEPGTKNVIVGTDEDGDIIPPETVGEFTQIDGKAYRKTAWAIPIGVIEGEQGPIPVKKPNFQVVELDGITSDFDVTVRTTTAPREKPTSGLTIAANVSEKQAATEAVEWMLENQQDGVEVPLRNLLSEPQLRTFAVSIDRIRPNSNLAIPHIEGHFEALHEISVNRWNGGYLIRHSSGRLFRLLVEEVSYDKQIAYIQPIGGFAKPVSDISVSNEHNLRDEIAVDTYSTVKNHVGEIMARFTNEELVEFKALEIEDVNEGFVNPSPMDTLDPADRNEGTLIDSSESGRWKPLPENIRNELNHDERYIITEEGLYKATDNYLLTRVIDPDTWVQNWDLETDPISISDFELTNPVEEPEVLPDRSDPITELPQIGPARSETIHATTIEEALNRGLPFFDVPQNGQNRILDIIHSMDSKQRFGTIAKFGVLGMLGGIGYDERGTQIGTIASLLVDDLDPRFVEWAWIGVGEGIKKDYRTDLDETPNHDDFIAGVGTPEAGRITTHLESFEGDVFEHEVTTLRKATTNVGAVALGNPESEMWADLPTDLFEFISHALQIDFTDPENLKQHVTRYTLEKAKASTPLLEFRHPDTNTVAVVIPLQGFDSTNLSLEEWTPWQAN